MTSITKFVFVTFVLLVVLLNAVDVYCAFFDYLPNPCPGNFVYRNENCVCDYNQYYDEENEMCTDFDARIYSLE